MPDLPDGELRAMALAIDSSHEPRVRIEAGVSAEGARRVRDVLAAVAADLDRQAGIEATWPVVCMLAILEEAVGE